MIQQVFKISEVFGSGLGTRELGEMELEPD